MNSLLEFNSWLNGIVWGPYMLILLVGTGVYLTIRTNFFAIFKFGYVLRHTFFKMFQKDPLGEGEITPFQALATALSATVGTGNIAGVATAIAIGGPGAIFWMWVSAVFGMTTKFGEVVLAVKYREKKEDGRFVGGPMYYLEKGLGKKWLAVVFSIFGALAAFGIGNMVQSNSVAAAMEASFGINKMVTGLLLAVAAAAVILGGIKRIAKVTEKLIPIMAAFYILGAIIVILFNFSKVPYAFGLIFSSAFSGTAALGGFAGATLMMAMRRGVARGVFSNEAGLGSAPIAHAAAVTDHPVRQGLWGVFEVFIDTLFICSLTALAILTSGVWTVGKTGAAMTTEAFNSAIPGGGGFIVAIGLLLFAYSTILGWSYYGERCAEHVLGKRVNMAYRILWIPFIVIGAVGGLEAIWDLSDTMNGLMAIPNLIGLLLLSNIIVTETKEFFNNIYVKEMAVKAAEEIAPK